MYTRIIDQIKKTKIYFRIWYICMNEMSHNTQYIKPNNQKIVIVEMRNESGIGRTYLL